MVKACSRIPGMYSIVNFGRKELEQTGSGHFACLGGYHPQSNKVLVMDTARFKYPSFWVDLDRLYDSVKSLDKDCDKMRGFMVLSKNQNVIHQFLDIWNTCQCQIRSMTKFVSAGSKSHWRS